MAGRKERAGDPARTLTECVFHTVVCNEKEAGPLTSATDLGRDPALVQEFASKIRSKVDKWDFGAVGTHGRHLSAITTVKHYATNRHEGKVLEEALSEQISMRRGPAIRSLVE